MNKKIFEASGILLPVTAHRFKVRIPALGEYQNIIERSIEGATIDYLNNTFDIKLAATFASTEYLAAIQEILDARGPLRVRESRVKVPLRSVLIDFLSGSGREILGRVELVGSELTEFGLNLSYANEGVQYYTFKGSFKKVINWRVEEDE